MPTVNQPKQAILNAPVVTATQSPLETNTVYVDRRTRWVEVDAGFEGHAQLPNGLPAVAGDVVALTEEEFALLSPTTLEGVDSFLTELTESEAEAALAESE